MAGLETVEPDLAPRRVSFWWVPHAVLTAAFYGSLPWAVITPDSADYLVPIEATIFIAFYASFLGYYWDAKTLRAAGADWVPKWEAWMVAHFVLWMLVAPVYVVVRVARVGVR